MVLFSGSFLGREKEEKIAWSLIASGSVDLGRGESGPGGGLVHVLVSPAGWSPEQGFLSLLILEAVCMGIETVTVTLFR